MSPRSARRDQWTAAGLGLLALAYLAAGRRYPLDTLTTVSYTHLTLPTIYSV